MRCETYFDILNRLGVDHQCDGQTAEGPLAISRSNIIRVARENLIIKAEILVLFRQGE